MPARLDDAAVLRLLESRLEDLATAEPSLRLAHFAEPLPDDHRRFLLVRSVGLDLRQRRRNSANDGDSADLVYRLLVSAPETATNVYALAAASAAVVELYTPYAAVSAEGVRVSTHTATRRYASDADETGRIAEAVIEILGEAFRAAGVTREPFIAPPAP